MVGRFIYYYNMTLSYYYIGISTNRPEFSRYNNNKYMCVCSHTYYTNVIFPILFCYIYIIYV